MCLKQFSVFGPLILEMQESPVAKGEMPEQSSVASMTGEARTARGKPGG